MEMSNVHLASTSIPVSQIVIDTLGLFIALLNLYNLHSKARTLIGNGSQITPKPSFLRSESFTTLMEISAKAVMIGWSILGYYETRVSQNKATAALSTVYIAQETYVTIAICRKFQIFKSGRGKWGVWLAGGIMSIILIMQAAAICLPWPEHAAFVKLMNGLSGLMSLVTTMILSYIMTSLLLELRSRIVMKDELQRHNIPKGSGSLSILTPLTTSTSWRKLLTFNRHAAEGYTSIEEVEIQRTQLQIVAFIISTFCLTIALLYVAAVLSKVGLNSLIWLAVPMYLWLLSKVRNIGLTVLVSGRKVDKAQMTVPTFAPEAGTNKMSVAVFGNTVQTGMMMSRAFVEEARPKKTEAALDSLSENAKDVRAEDRQSSAAEKASQSSLRAKSKQKSILKKSAANVESPNNFLTAKPAKSAEMSRSQSTKLKVDWKDRLEAELRRPVSKNKLVGIRSTDDVSLARPRGSKNTEPSAPSAPLMDGVNHVPHKGSLPNDLSAVQADDKQFFTAKRDLADSQGASSGLSGSSHDPAVM